MIARRRENNSVRARQRIDEFHSDNAAVLSRRIVSRQIEQWSGKYARSRPEHELDGTPSINRSFEILTPATLVIFPVTEQMGIVGDFPSGLRLRLRTPRRALELPSFKIVLGLGPYDRKQSRQRPSARDFLFGELVVQCGGERFLRDGIGNIGGNDDNAIAVAGDHVARIDRDAATADRQIEIDGLMHDRARWRGRPAQIGG